MPVAPHLLLINPNTSGHVTALLARHALALAPPGAVLTAVTAPFGEPYIASEAAAAIAERAVPAAWAAPHQWPAGHGACVWLAVVGVAQK
jgi:allantoin racemase